MKKFLLIVLLGGLLLGMCPSAATAADRFFVVVASFSKASAASTFGSSIRALFPDVAYLHDGDLKLHHVYALETDRYEDARRYRDHVRKDMGFNDAWIYKDFHSSGMSPDLEGNDGTVALELYTGETVLLSSAGQGHLTIAKGVRATKERSIPTSSFNFVAKTVNGIEVPGKVMLVGKSGEVLATLRTGEHFSLGGNEGRQVLRLIFSADGYSPAALDVDIAKLGKLSDVYQNGDGVWEVNFHATKLHENKVHLLYHDLFHPGSAVLREESRHLLDAWVSMLKSSINLRATIDTHCQPGEKRKIRLPSSSDDLFDLTGGVDENGSDKRLTKERAEVLRAYLISKGIGSKRITALGWGSIDPLVSHSAPNPEVNERVELILTAP